MSASSWLVTCGIITQLRCRFAPPSLRMRDSSLRSTGPNFAKSTFGQGSRPGRPRPPWPPAGALAACARVCRPPAITPLTKPCTSSCVMRPFGPEPFTSSSGTPSSRANLRIVGEACGSAPCGAVGSCAGSAAVGATFSAAETGTAAATGAGAGSGAAGDAAAVAAAVAGAAGAGAGGAAAGAACGCRSRQRRPPPAAAAASLPDLVAELDLQLLDDAGVRATGSPSRPCRSRP